MNAWFPIAAAIGVSVAALIGSGVILLLGKRGERAEIWLLSYAIGTLLGAATLGLLPEAIEHASVEAVMPLLLGGIIAFIIIERVIRWRHTHEGHDHVEHHGSGEIDRATGIVLLWGDGIHNFVDGLVIGVTFRVSPELGVLSTLAIFAHEVPQEIGDFAVLLRSGMSKLRAVILNYLSAAAVIPGAILAFFWTGASTGTIGLLLPIAAGSFIYIALSDLVPSLHHRRGRWAGTLQIVLILIGVATMVLLRGLHGE
jgi:zinc and cadmium transporter